MGYSLYLLHKMEANILLLCIITLATFVHCDKHVIKSVFQRRQLASKFTDKFKECNDECGKSPEKPKIPKEPKEPNKLSNKNKKNKKKLKKYKKKLEKYQEELKKYIKKLEKYEEKKKVYDGYVDCSESCEKNFCKKLCKKEDNMKYKDKEKCQEK